MNRAAASAVATISAADLRSASVLAIAGLILVVVLRGVGLVLLGAGCGPPS